MTFRKILALRLSSRLESTYASSHASTSSHDGFASLLKSRPSSAGRIKPSFATTSPTLAGESASSTTTPEDVVEVKKKTQSNEVPANSFTTLKPHIKFPIYKALTDSPFQFKTMSAVQERVLGLLPELAAPSARGAPKAEVNENADVTARGKRQMATDLLVKAKTGTGKTVAFLVPALEARHRDLKEEARRFAEENPNADLHTRSRHLKQYEVDTVGAVILSPTRELATQIATEATRLLHHQKGWGVQLFIGGASKGRQFGEFYRGRRDILVATPGRLIDMLDDPRVFKAVSDAKMLIFDEADTLLDMGFKDQIKEIVDTLPPKDKRQTFMFSATVSKEVQQIAKASLKSDHTFIDCVPANETNSHLHIPQYQTILSQPSQQIPHIFNLLAQDALLHPQGGKAIIFLPTTKLTEMFALVVKAMRSSLPWGIRNTTVLEMHAQKTQAARDRCSEDFRNAKGPGYTILVTTDVSARGVDYPGVTRVIQVGIPPSKDNYVHRVGRTGRAGKEGRGDIVLQSWEASYVPYQLQKMPLKTISPDDVQAEVEALATEIDANPPKAVPAPRAEFGRQNRHERRLGYGSRYEPPAVMETPILPRIQNFPTKLTEMILPEFSEEHVSEAFGSMLGFYAGHSSELRASKSDILEGLRSWSVEAGGLPRAPTTSPEFLSKIGINIKSRSFTARAGFGITRKDRNFGMNDRRDGYQALRNSGGRGGFDRDSRRGGFDRSSRDGGFGRSDFGGGKPSFRSSDNDRRPSFGSGRRSERLPF